MRHVKILIVEDEPVTAAVLERTLGQLGYSVAGVAATAKDAIEKTEHTKPDLVLMDVHLNGPVDGIEAARQIRILFDIPVIYLTASSDVNSLLRAQATQPAGYLLKPIKKDELVASVEMALCKSESHSTEQQEQLFSDILNTLDEGVVAFDDRDRVRIMNYRAEVALAMPRTDAWNMSADEIMTHLVHGSAIAIVRDIPIKNENGKVMGRVFVFPVRDAVVMSHA
jgi:CheY-like chemotaxis protein